METRNRQPRTYGVPFRNSSSVRKKKGYSLGEVTTLGRYTLWNAFLMAELGVLLIHVEKASSSRVKVSIPKLNSWPRLAYILPTMYLCLTIVQYHLTESRNPKHYSYELPDPQAWL